jgi:hypothetical protein
MLLHTIPPDIIGEKNPPNPDRCYLSIMGIPKRSDISIRNTITYNILNFEI